MAGGAESYLQISMVFCAANCTISSSTLLPECNKSPENCCSPDPMSCFSYYTCYNDQPQHIFCGPLQSFNEQKLICENNEVICYPKCAARCPTDDYGDPLCIDNGGSCCLPNSNNCKYFLTCSKGQIGLGECPQDAVFDETQLACLPQGEDICYLEQSKCKVHCDPKQTICDKDCCGPEAGACSQQYYSCQQGVRTVVACPSLTSFNSSTLECDRHSYDTCNQENISPECSETPVAPSNPPTNYTTSPNISNGGDQIITEKRRLLSKEEFLTAMYSVYKEIGERFTVRT